MNKNPLVTVIITTKNEEDVIKALLSSVKKQTYKDIEILLIDNNSTDKTKKIAESFGARIHDFGPERSAQRNYGARQARGECLFFLDADMLLPKKTVRKCVDTIQENNKTAALIIPEISIASNFWEKVKAFERSFYSLNGDSVTDAARFFRKKIFIKTGGYDEGLTGPEDWDLTDRVRKLGFRINRVKQGIYHKERVPSILFLIKKKYYYGLYAHKYLSKHNTFLFGPRTIYFLRPVFYKNWKKLLKHPILFLSFFVLLFLEQIGGGFGYIYGRVRNL